MLEQLERDSRPVLGDPARRMVGKAELKRLHPGGDHRHGFGYVDPAEERRSSGSAAYYAWSPRPGVRMIALDTSAEGGRSQGNLDDPQYRWLARELDRNTSVSLDSRGRVRRDRDRDRLIVVSGHHPLAGMSNGWADERSGPCTRAVPGGCDADPRSSRPVHRGTAGRRSLLSLLQRHPGVIAYVAGHEHRNRVTPHFRRDGRGGLWEIVTASSIDFPGQARLIELMDNRDGTLSIFGTLVDQAAPLSPPPSGTPASAMTEADLASLARALAANGPVARYAAGARGRRRDRNVELLVRDPRRLAARVSIRRRANYSDRYSPINRPTNRSCGVLGPRPLEQLLALRRSPPRVGPQGRERAANAPRSPRGTQRPGPSSSGRPPIAVATTGTPAAIASSAA